MDCPECAWNQVYLSIFVNSIIALIIAILFKFIIIPKIETIYAKNEFNVKMGLIGKIDGFDVSFKGFYEIFENRFLNIRDIPDGEWIRNYSKLQEFEEHKERIFKNTIGQMEFDSEDILEYMNKNKDFLTPGIRLYVKRYVDWTIFYVNWFLKGWNYTDRLHKRRDIAFQIIKILKDEEDFKMKVSRWRKLKKFGDIPHIGEFVKKWQEYEKEESNKHRV